MVNIQKARQHNSPISPRDLKGVYTALITPMLVGSGLDNQIDYEKLYRLIDDQVKNRIDGIVVAGTTGQSSTLSPLEHRTFVSDVFDYVKPRYPNLQFIVGAGSNCTREAIELSRNIEDDIGPSTFLHVTGYYNNPPQEGIIAHFKTLASQLPRSNIILYSVPGRTNSEIKPQTTIILANSTENIIGIKEASGNLESVKEIVANTDRNRFAVLSGEDHLVSPIMWLGGRGVISASANAAPRYFVELTRAALKNDYTEADRLQEEINYLVKEGVFFRKNPIPLAEMFETELRLPLVRLTGISSHLNAVLSRYTPEQLGIDLRNYRKC